MSLLVAAAADTATSDGISSAEADILFLKHGSSMAFSDSHPTLCVVHGRDKPVLRGPNSTQLNLFHQGETIYRVG